MADTVKYEKVLNIECLFVDGDYRTITLKHPKSGITENEIKNLETFMQENNIIIGDRDGSDFRRIKKVVSRESTTMYLDLEPV